MADNSTNQTEQESILNAGLSDQATEEDYLGFEPYVTAIAQFLTNDKTKPPLTLSIEGEWGTGKSSFMKQLRKKLKDKPTVWFNAWRHDKAEALWAAFALEFIRQISRPRRRRDVFRILKGNIKLLWLRLDWKNGFQTIALALVLISFVVIIVILLFSFISRNFSGESENILKLIIGGGGFSGVILLFFKFKDEIIGDLKNDLTKYLKSPNYETQVAFVEKFHEDFRKIVEAYAGKQQRLYVFIDDLDRCEVPKSAELMQAINMMISNDPQLIFILGMDREKVAAGFAVKYKDLIPYLGLDAENKVSRSEFIKGIDYSYAFMEKFIQLPFQVPQPTKFEKFLEEISRPVSKETSQTGRIQIPGINFIRQIFAKSNQQNPNNNSTTRPENESSDIQPEEAEKRESRINIEEINQPDTVREIARMVASALDNNPRRGKQFINVFRLKAYIAYHTGLFDETATQEHLTLEQLGKFTAISLKWPRLLVDLNTDRQLLKKLQELALNNLPDSEDDPITQYRGYDKKLFELLRYPGQEPDSPEKKINIEAKYSLAKVKVEKLIQVSPRVTRSREKGVDYTKLRDLLAAKRWKEADQETLAVMLKVAGREEQGWLDIESIENFPCTDLRTINQFWVKSSNGRFGFSVQKRIWESVGGNLDTDHYSLEKFGDKVGWRVNESWISYYEVTFDTSAPDGHLPTPTALKLSYYGYMINRLLLILFSSFTSRLVKCNI